MGKADSPKAGGTGHDLGAADVKRVKAFMVTVTRSFELADPDLLCSLSHEGEDPGSRQSSRWCISLELVPFFGRPSTLSNHNLTYSRPWLSSRL